MNTRASFRHWQYKDWSRRELQVALGAAEYRLEIYQNHHRQGLDVPEAAEAHAREQVDRLKQALQELDR